MHWDKTAVITTASNLPWGNPQANQCWATDGAYKNGFWYWYLSVGGSQVAVVRSKSPAGPWEDVLGKPLLSDALAKSLDPPTTFRDPGILEDPTDGAVYLISGVFTYYIAKLNDDSELVCVCVCVVSVQRLHDNLYVMSNVDFEMLYDLLCHRVNLYKMLKCHTGSSCYAGS